MDDREIHAKSGVICPRCERHFACGMTGGQEQCWCMEKPVLPIASGEGAQCMCPGCLDQLLSEHTVSEA